MHRAATSLTIILFGCSDVPDAGPVGPVGVGDALFVKATQSASWTPMSISVFNDCTGESVSLAGGAHITSRLWTEGGRVFIKGHTNLSLAGVGQISGRGYRLLQTTNTAVTLDVTAGTSSTDQVHHLSMISGGGLPNARVTMNGTVTMDASGNATVVPKKWESSCR